MRLTNFAAVLLFTGALIGHVSSLAYAERPCNSPYDLDRVLSPVQCQTGPPVNIFSQDSHFASSVRDTNTELTFLANQENWQVYTEGELFVPEQLNRNGLELRQLKSLADVIIASPILQSTMGTSDNERLLLMLSRKAFTESISFWPELLSKVEDSLSPDDRRFSEEKELIGKIRKVDSGYFTKGFDWGSSSTVNTSLSETLGLNVSARDQSSIGDLARRWADLAGREIIAVKETQFLGTGSLDYVNYGRSVLFVKFVLKQYCQVHAKKLLWISIGSGHEKETQCLLNKYLPKKTSITVIPSKLYNSKFNNWYENFKTSPAYTDFSNQLATFGLEIKSGKQAEQSPYMAVISLSGELALKQTASIDKVLRRRGYLVQKSGSISNVLIIAPML